MPRLRSRSTARSFVGVAVVVLVASGCVGSIGRDEFADEYQARGGGLSADVLVDTARSIEERIAPAELLIRSATLSPLSVTLTVSASDRPAETDSWTWSPGGLLGPYPTSNLDDDEQSRSFRIESLDADAIEYSIDAAVTSSDLRDPYATAATFVGTVDGSFVGTVGVTNQRDSETWFFDPDGTLTRSGS